MIDGEFGDVYILVEIQKIAFCIQTFLVKYHCTKW